MKNFKTTLLYVLLLWVIPFIIGFAVFPLKNADRVFFESIMAVVLVITTAVLSRKAASKAILRSWQTGLVWLVMCLVLDQAFFTWGPQKMAFSDYWRAIGLKYLVIPVITWVADMGRDVEGRAEVVTPSSKHLEVAVDEVDKNDQK